MRKLLFYFIALFVLFFACTQDQPKHSNTETNVATNATTDEVKDIPTPTPIAPPKSPEQPNIKPIPQASKKDLIYPERFQQAGVAKYKGAKVTNNNILKNNQGKYGQRISLSCAAKYDEVLNFHKEDLVKNGWEHDPKMDKSHKDEDVTFFATNYTKDNYTLMIAVTELGVDNISVAQLLKEN